jgi:hypothetical protein
VIVPAFIVKESQRTGAIVKDVEAVPAVLRIVVFAVVTSPVFTGSTRSSDCAGSERYNCFTTEVGLIVTVCVEVFGPPQPAALAVMTVVPLQAAI